MIEVKRKIRLNLPPPPHTLLLTNTMPIHETELRSSWRVRWPDRRCVGQPVVGLIRSRHSSWVAAGALGLLAACGDLTKTTAQFTNENQPFFVHALSGSALPFTTALLMPTRTVTRVDGALSFDVAFDLNSAGDIVLLPVNTVGQGTSGGHAVGILKPGGAYENILEAPRTGYRVDSITVVKRGEAVIIQSQEPSCGFSISPYLHAKLVIDSVDVSGRAMFGRTTININCGFRSLKSGLPEF